MSSSLELPFSHRRTKASGGDSLAGPVACGGRVGPSGVDGPTTTRPSRRRDAEVVPLVEVGDEAELDRLPGEELARQSARGRRVYGHKVPQPREVLARLV